jgi:hypothetical protein
MDKDAIIQALRNGGNEGHNFLQAMSNGIADGSVGGTVDMLGSGLEAIGVPVGNAPFMGSKWLKQNGYMRDVQPGAGQILGEGLGMAAGGAAFNPAELANVVKSGVSRYLK